MINVNKLKKEQLIKLTELHKFYLSGPIDSYTGIVTEVNRNENWFTFKWLKKHKEFQITCIKVSGSALNWYKVYYKKVYPDE